MGAETVTLQQFPTRALEAYSDTEFARLDRKLSMFRSLPSADQQLLPEFETRLSAMTSCVDVNARLLARMADAVDNISSTAAAPTPTSSSSPSGPSSSTTPSTSASAPTQTPPPSSDQPPPPGDDPKLALHKSIRLGFSSLAVDWSAAGAAERALVYAPVLAAIDDAYGEARRAMRSLERDGFRVLVPGAGSGRLAWELARKGYCVEGCEDSFIQLMLGNFVMNSIDVVNDGPVTMYPYVHDHANAKSKASVTRAVEIPDVNPKDVPASADFTMRAARFVDAYDGHDAKWDAVASFRAFDVGEHALEHARRVAQILKPGGVWVVAGPTPCVDGAQGDGVHVSAEEFVEVVRRCGFKIIKSEVCSSLYSNDEQSLRTVHVECPFIVAVKVRPLA